MSTIGIDLGTTYCCVGVWRNNRVEIIANEQGNRVTASCVAFGDNERIIGDAAKNQSAMNPVSTIFDIKRLIGQQFNTNIEGLLKYWPFKVIQRNGKPYIGVLFRGQKKLFTPEEITSMILMNLKETAEMYLGELVSDAVISVPACFSDAQRQAIRDAGLIAGLNVVRLVNEPTATALTYGVGKDIQGEKCILIYDLGGGSFDASIVTIDEGSLFEVKSCAGHTYLGGEDFDDRLVDYLVEEFCAKYGENIIKGNQKALRRLRVAAERAKRILSSSMETTVEVDALYDGIDFNIKIYRSKFEELCDDLFKMTIDIVDKVINDAKIQKSEIHDVILVGGSSRIPKIQQMLQNYFSSKQMNFSVNPDEAVAYGATTFAAVLKEEPSLKVTDILLVDIVSFDIEIETLNGMRTVLIDHNTRLPYKHSQYFTTYKDNQTTVALRLYENEKLTSGSCRLLGQFTITGIEPAARGIAQIEVTFDLDTNGILNVTAKENSTGQSRIISVSTAKSRLSDDAIEKMIVNARVLKLEDEVQKEKVKTRNRLESCIFKAKQAVYHSATSDSLTDAEKHSRLEQCDNMLQWLDNHSKIEKDQFDEKIQILRSILHPITFKVNDNDAETEEESSRHSQ